MLSNTSLTDCLMGRNLSAMLAEQWLSGYSQGATCVEAGSRKLLCHLLLSQRPKPSA